MKIGDKVIVVEGVYPTETGLTGIIVTNEENLSWQFMVSLNPDGEIYGFDEHHLKLANCEIIKERLGIK